MKKKTGFTLVELLAVIVILAIIAVIAVLSVLKIISGAREDAFKANVRSAIKAIELEITKDTTGTKTSGNLSTLDIDNNPFKGGTWYYDKKLKKVIIYEARDSETIEGSNYVITGDKEEINSKDLVVAKPGDNNPNLLKNKMINGTTLGTLGSIDNKDSETGYIKGANPNNYVYLKLNKNNTKFRVVRTYDDGSILMIKNEIFSVSPVSFDYHGCEFDDDEISITGDCSNFANSDIKEYINNDFYNTITNKNLIKYNEWYTELTDDDITYGGTPSSTIAKVGLLTLRDYITVIGVPYYTEIIPDNYLNIDKQWWLGTGRLDGTYVWYVTSDYIPQEELSYYEEYARPTVVLNSGITLTCTLGSGDGQCDGTSERPYRIE